MTEPLTDPPVPETPDQPQPGEPIEAPAEAPAEEPTEDEDADADADADA